MLRKKPVPSVVAKSRFEVAKGGVAGISVQYGEPRAAVVAKIRHRLSEPLSTLAATGGEVDRAVEIEVWEADQLTDRFVRSGDGGYMHHDLVAGTSASIPPSERPSSKRELVS